MDSIRSILKNDDSTAMIHGGRSVTQRELLHRARCAAGALRERGLRSGERVLLRTSNSIEGVAAWLGIVLAGGTVVPVPRGAAQAEIDAYARVTRARVGLTDAKHIGNVLDPIPIDDLDGEPFETRPAETAMILFTSGTTGSAKGACISHASIVAHTRNLVDHVLRLDSSDVVLAVLPVAHSYGIRMTVLAPLFAGARVVLDDFSAEASLRACAEHGVTWLPGVPTMFHAWANVPGAPPTSLRWALSAGASLSDDVRRRAEARLGVSVREGYGLTEATFCCIDAPPEPATAGSVGPSVPGVDVCIAEDGEILVRGTNVMSGYLDDPEATQRVMHDGWLRTGDLGRLDERGRLFVIDRLKDLIVRGGHNVVPAEVENVLVDHPSVREAAVVGRPDARYGEEIVCVLVAEAFDPAELDRWCRERLGTPKVPREWVRIDAMPLGPSRKVLRRELRARIEAGTLVPSRFP